MSDVEMTDAEYEYEYDSDEDPSLVENGGKSHDNSTSSTSFSYSDDDDDNASNPNSPLQFSSSTVDTSNKSLIVMSEAEDLKPKLISRLNEVAEALGVTLAAAAPLLRCQKWSLQSLLQNYYSDPQSVYEQAGVVHRCRQLLGEQAKESATTASTTAKDCLICMEPLLAQDSNRKSLCMPCGHDFCLDCWEEYLTHCIQMEGSTCVLATCPEATCTEVITETEVQLVAAVHLPKFQHYQLQSFVESNPRFQWCPGKDCDWVAQASPALESSLGDNKTTLTTNIQAGCGACGASFCFGCGEEESHLPVACMKLKLWKAKNQDESETYHWLLANTKACPKCSARISKDGGCMHMRCTKCHHGFCWMCMGTHHVHQCNSYQETDDDTQRAKNELERYLHYYERYHGHDNAQEFAQKQVDKLKEEEFNDTYHVPAAEAAPTSPGNAKYPVQQDADSRVDLRLLLDANLQLVNCRRVLKYTYVFAYYHFENNASTSGATKLQIQRFENHQGILEGLTEGLSKVAELPPVEIDPQDITNRTRVIGQFIRKVLECVENEMA